MEHPCSVPYSTLRNTLQSNRSLGEKHDFIFFWNDLDSLKQGWIFLFSVTRYLSLCSYCQGDWAALSFNADWKQEQQVKYYGFRTQLLMWQILEKKSHVYKARPYIQSLIISANFMSWFGALSLHYHHLIRKAVVGYAMTLDGDKILPWR